MKTPKKITDAAKGEPCTLNIPGHCNYNIETTCFCHHDDGTGGSNRLTGPLSGGIGCSGCHDCIDGRVPTALSQDDMEFFKRRSQNRTINRLIELGLVKVAGL
ncbi:MAG: nuclease domain-containing protein [Gammaproteobacteria bacterium]